MGVLSDKTVGEFVDKHFASCYEQVGDFRVTATTNGDIDRNGGNVATYFLTPDLKVINAVVGPVQPKDFLAAAQFAVELNAKQVQPDEWNDMYEAAHLEASGIDPSRYYQVISEKLPRITRQYDSRKQGILGSRALAAKLNRGEITLEEPIVTARKEAMRAFSLDKRDSLTHRILASKPGASVYDVYQELFERVAGQRVSVDRTAVGVAADSIKGQRPTLFVIYNSVTVDGNPQGPGLANERMIESLKKRAGNSYSVVALPNDQLASLSSQVDIPVYLIRVQPAVIVVKDGKKVGHFTLHDSSTKIDAVLSRNK